MLERLLGKRGGSSTGQGRKPSGKFPPRPITVTELQQLIPLRSLSEEELNAFALTQRTETYAPGSVLFERGETEAHVLYLLRGTVTMRLNDEQSYEVTAGTAKARFPLSSGEAHNTTAIARTDVEVIRVLAKVMRKNLKDQLEDDRLLDPNRWRAPKQLRNSQLFQAFCQNFLNEELTLPTLPDIALALRKAIEKEDIGVAEAATIVQADASIAANLMHIANSPLYLAANPVRTCLEAINRLGLRATCNLTLSLCMRHVFKSKDAFLCQKMRDSWQEGLHVAALAYVLAKDNHWHDPEEAFLAGLICNIGIIPFLTFADGFPKSYYQQEEIDAALPVIRGPIGYYILKKWGFPDELVEIPRRADAWHYDDDPELSLGDIVMLSRLHRCMETARMNEVPPINSIPACNKLRNGSLSPEYSLQVLCDARTQVQEILKILR
ncbi:MAG: HDOD domain-containing protein [Methylothermaceae bacterium]|nr:HDOD domain-containing protein [Methylothermaceae bacterium]